MKSIKRKMINGQIFEKAENLWPYLVRPFEAVHRQSDEVVLLDVPFLQGLGGKKWPDFAQIPHKIQLVFW